jgi:NAD(P)H-quinone oxidoreductase subunit H
MNRIANHLLWLGPFMLTWRTDSLLLHFRERELIYDLWEAATGYRMVNNNTSALEELPLIALRLGVTSA